MNTTICYHGKTPLKNKFWELENYFSSWNSFKWGWEYWKIQPLCIDDTNYFAMDISLGWLFTFDLRWTKKKDHAGFSFTLSLGWWVFTFTIYDHRHWDDVSGDWMKYPDEEKKA